MKFNLEAQPGELLEKGERLVDMLAHALEDEAPELAESLHKALPAKEQGLKYPVLQELHKREGDAYARTLQAMVKDIGKVLDHAAGRAGLTKSEPVDEPWQCDCMVKAGVEGVGGLVSTQAECALCGGSLEDLLLRSEDWLPLPEEIGEAFWGEMLEKAAGHKYIRRVPTGKAKPKWRYYYNVTGGRGLGHETEYQKGAKFAFEHDGVVGHYEVTAAADGQVTVKHDESGHEMTMSQADLTALLRGHHGKKIEAAISRATETRQEAEKHGSEKQVKRAQERERKLLEQFGKEAEPTAVAPAPPEVERPTKPLPTAAPALPRASLRELGPGGYDNIEGFSLDATDLERQAATLSQDREYAVIAQANGYVLASRAKGEVGRELKGAQTAIFLPSKSGGGLQQLEAEWVIMEADDIVASHNPETFAQREDYPEGVQERRYHQIKPEQLKVDRIARTLEPAFAANTNPGAIDGAPIITEDGIVLGGNGRTMGMQRAYLQYPESAGKLKDYLTEQARQFGLSSGQVAAMKKPILVRRVQAGKDREKLTALGRWMNEPLTQGLDPRSEEVAISKRVTSELVDTLTHHMAPDQTLADFLGGGESRGFVRALEHAAIIDQYNRAKFINQETGLLNEDGRGRVMRVLAARLLPDAAILDGMDQSLRNNLAQAVPFFLQAEKSGWDIREHLMSAVRADMEMSARRYKRNKIGRADYQSQPALPGAEGGGHAEAVRSGLPAALLELIQDHNGPRKLQNRMKRFAIEADRQAHDHGSQGSMFARAKVEPEDALRQAMAGESAQQGDLLAASLRDWMDLQKAESAGNPAHRYLMHAIHWEAKRLMKAAGTVAAVERSQPDLRRALVRLQAFVEDQAGVDPIFAAAHKDKPVSRGQLLAVLEAEAKARGHRPALGPGLAKSFQDHTQDLFTKDDRAYQRVKDVLMRRGYGPEEFEEGGSLYGLSVNQLIDLEREARGLAKSGGPFIGPRGGKWADPGHTIPWREEIPHKTLREQAHDAVKAEVLEAAHRAAAAGADADSLRYVGAGGEGVLFRDKSGRAYKVGRFKSLANEAGALEALQGTPAEKYAPRFYGFDAKHNVLVRDHVEGRPAAWSEEGGLREPYGEIVEALKAAEWSAPEFKADSFIVAEGQPPKMVDVGFVNPRGKRSVKDLEDRIAAGDVEYLGDLFELRTLYAEGHVSYEKAMALSRKMGGLVPGHKLHPHWESFTHEAQERGELTDEDATQLGLDAIADYEAGHLHLFQVEPLVKRLEEVQPAGFKGDLRNFLREAAKAKGERLADEDVVPMHEGKPAWINAEDQTTYDVAKEAGFEVSVYENPLMRATAEKGLDRGWAQPEVTVPDDALVQGLELKRYGSPDKFAVVHRSTKPESKGRWQVSWMDSEGPVGDTTYATLTEALKGERQEYYLAGVVKREKPKPAKGQLELFKALGACEHLEEYLLKAVTPVHGVTPGGYRVGLHNGLRTYTKEARKPEQLSLLDQLKDEADKADVELENYFPSGSNHSGEIEGFVVLGFNVGVAAPKLNATAEHLLTTLRGTGRKVFLDSGAFSEMEFPADGPPVVAKPITDAEWENRLDLYARLGKALGRQLYAVAPDQVANQAVTLERMRRYRAHLKDLERMGVNILAPIQKGSMSMAEFDAAVGEAMGLEDYVRAIPMKKDATTVEDLVEFLAARPQVKRVHLLGLGPKGDQYPAVRAALAKHAPDVQVTMDSVAIKAAVGRKGGKVAKLTAVQDKVREEMADRVYTDIHGVDYTDEVVEEVNEWLAPSRRERVAGELAGLGLMDEAGKRQFKRDPYAWLQARDEDGAANWDSPYVEDLLDQEWKRHMVGAFEVTADGNVKLLGGRGTTHERKRESTIRYFGDDDADA